MLLHLFFPLGCSRNIFIIIKQFSLFVTYQMKIFYREETMRRSVLENWIVKNTGCASRAELEQWQLTKLQETIAYAKGHSSFYQSLLCDVDEKNFTCYENLASIPFTTAEQLRQNPQSWLCHGQAEIKRIITLKTSGTTNSPKRIFFHREDQERTVDFFACGMKELVSPGDRVLILMPGAQPGSVGALLQEALTRIKVKTVLGGTVTDIEHTYQQLKDTGCNSIVGIPAQILGLSEYGCQFPPEERANIKSILLSADTTPPPLIDRIRNQMNCQVFTHFGMTEMGFGVSVECQAHHGCHIRENDILVEVINPKTGVRLPDGQLGEFVFTTLNHRAMPFIRYRTGDMGMLLSEPCSCGSFIKRMLPWGGRLSDQGQLWELDNLLFSCPDVVDYTLDENGLALLGVVPPDIKSVQLQLTGYKKFHTIPIHSKRITGFTGTGMQKRTL